MQRHAHVYVCGDASNLAPDVHEARNCGASDHSRAGDQKIWLASNRSISSTTSLKNSRVAAGVSTDAPSSAPGAKRLHLPTSAQPPGRLVASALLPPSSRSPPARLVSPRQSTRAPAPPPDIRTPPHTP